MQSADRALAILAAFSDSRRQLGVSELAGELGMHKSTVSRLLGTLQGRGLVRRDGDRFSPGPELARLGAVAIEGLEVMEVARGPLEGLAEETGETVTLAVREGDAAMHVHQVQTSHFVGATDWTGRGTPLHCTATGKALLAFGGGPLPEELPALTPKTITEPAALRAELERTRRRAYSLARDELELGLHAAGAPIFHCNGLCVAAVAASGPAYRLRARRLREVALRCAATAEEISGALGYRRAA
jgi:DNA-binding IclR family transcriptional regulator